jgi:hypothetical protein
MRTDGQTYVTKLIVNNLQTRLKEIKSVQKNKIQQTLVCECRTVADDEVDSGFML